MPPTVEVRQRGSFWIVICGACGTLRDGGGFWVLRSNAARHARVHRRTHRSGR
jgi:hypothetical protein